jgi:hypothetical protein
MSERTFALAVLLVASCLVALAVLTITDVMQAQIVAALEGR